jgi:hypothetical protein
MKRNLDFGPRLLIILNNFRIADTMTTEWIENESVAKTENNLLEHSKA